MELGSWRLLHLVSAASRFCNTNGSLMISSAYCDTCSNSSNINKKNCPDWLHAENANKTTPEQDSLFDLVAMELQRVVVVVFIRYCVCWSPACYPLRSGPSAC